VAPRSLPLCLFDPAGAVTSRCMGTNERARIRMTEEEVADFLAGRHNMSVATLGPDGRVHLVAMWYGFLDGDMAFETKAKSQKVQNLRRDDRITCLVEEGQTYDQLRGVELVGRAEIIEDRDRLWKIGISVFERHFGPVTPETEPAVEAMLHKRVGVRIVAERVVSWDHRKL
jgi:PPOX class probable F420-dependent enzyme